MQKIKVEVFIRENKADSIGNIFTPQALRKLNGKKLPIYYDLNKRYKVGIGKIKYKKGLGCGLIAWMISKRRDIERQEIDGRIQEVRVDTEHDFKLDGLSFCLGYSSDEDDMEMYVKPKYNKQGKMIKRPKYKYYKIRATKIGLCQGRNIDKTIEPLKGLDKIMVKK